MVVRACEKKKDNRCCYENIKSRHPRLLRVNESP